MYESGLLTREEIRGLRCLSQAIVLTTLALAEFNILDDALGSPCTWSRQVADVYPV